MKLLARWERRLPARGHKKRPPAPTRAEMMDPLDVTLARLDIRIVAAAPPPASAERRDKGGASG